MVEAGKIQLVEIQVGVVKVKQLQTDIVTQ